MHISHNYPGLNTVRNSIKNKVKSHSLLQNWFIRLTSKLRHFKCSKSQKFFLHHSLWLASARKFFPKREVWEVFIFITSPSRLLSSPFPARKQFILWNSQQTGDIVQTLKVYFIGYWQIYSQILNNTRIFLFPLHTFSTLLFSFFYLYRYV